MLWRHFPIGLGLARHHPRPRGLARYTHSSSVDVCGSRWSSGSSVMAGARPDVDESPNPAPNPPTTTARALQKRETDSKPSEPSQWPVRAADILAFAQLSRLGLLTRSLPAIGHGLLLASANR